MQQLFEFSAKHWDLILALVIILTMLIFNLFGARMRGYREVAPSEAVRLINQEDVQLLDVREDKEVAGGHIADAQLIPLGQLKGRMEELDKGRPVLAVCRSGQRSGSACGMLRKAGFENVYNLRGGVMAWSSANLPLQKPGKNKKRK